MGLPALNTLAQLTNISNCAIRIDGLDLRKTRRSLSDLRQILHAHLYGHGLSILARTLLSVDVFGNW